MNMIKKQQLLSILLSGFLCGIMPVRAQVEEVKFGVPFDFPLLLSGNFGELRSNHFHGGLDFKTQGVTGKPLLAIADGYIAKVTVTPGGYGNALYITHDNGYTSVHGHLDHFLPEIATLVRQKQYREQSFAMTLEFGPEDFRVRQGEVVAYAGNTGYSFGPHLHMEIRETATNEPIDPLPFYMDKIADNTAPRATHVMVYGASLSSPQGGRVLSASQWAVLDTNRKDAEENFVSSPLGENEGNPHFYCWGRIGTAISANDYMDGTTNNYGVRYVRLYVDNRLVSHSDVDRFAFAEDRLINSWTDYHVQRSTGRWYMRSTIADNNNLRMLHADTQRGWVTINEERDYHFRYELADLYGNTTTYRFVVRGRQMELPYRTPNYLTRMDASRDNRFYANGFELWVAQGQLFEDVELDYDVQPSETDLTDIYCLTKTRIPLRKSAEMTLPILPPSGVDASKLYVARVDGDRRIYSGGNYKFGRITANISELASYTVCIDTVAPKITPIGETAWKKRGVVTFRIADGETGIRSYRGMIDGRWVLFKYSSKTARLTCDLRAEGITRGRHEVKIVVNDLRGNKRKLVMNCEL